MGQLRSRWRAVRLLPRAGPPRHGGIGEGELMNAIALTIGISVFAVVFLLRDRWIGRNVRHRGDQLRTGNLCQFQLLGIGQLVGGHTRANDCCDFRRCHTPIFTEDLRMLLVQPSMDGSDTPLLPCPACETGASPDTSTTPHTHGGIVCALRSARCCTRNHCGAHVRGE